MNQSLKIAVADDEPRMVQYFCETLSALGHEVIATAGTGRELVERCRAARPELIITDIRMPDMDGIDAVDQVCRDEPIPAVLVSGHNDPDSIGRALRSHVLAYLIKPIKQADLEVAIAVAMWRFREFQALYREAADLRQTLEDRKVIERAKGFLMKRGGLDEPDAFRRLQKLASEKHRKMVEIAQMIITAEEALQD